MKSLNMLKFLLESVASMKLMSVIALFLLMIPLVSANIEMYSPEMPPDMEIEMFEESFRRDRDVLWGKSPAVWTTSYFYPTYLGEIEVDEFGRARKYIYTNCTGFSVNITKSRWFNITKDEFPYYSEGNNLTLSKVQMGAAYWQHIRFNVTEGAFMGIGFNASLTRDAVVAGNGAGFAIDLFVYNESLIHRWDIQFLVNFTISVYFISMYVWRYIPHCGCFYEPFSVEGITALLAAAVLMFLAVGALMLGFDEWRKEEGRKHGTRKSEPIISDTGNNRIRADN